MSLISTLSILHPHLSVAERHRRLVHRRCSRQPDGGASDYPLPALPVRRRASNQLRQRAPRDSRRAPDDAVRLHCLFRHIPALGIPLRIHARMGHYRHLDGIPLRAYLCRNHVLPPLPVQSEDTGQQIIK